MLTRTVCKLVDLMIGVCLHAMSVTRCHNYFQLLLMKKGVCPIKINKGHWVSDNNAMKPGSWDDNML